MAWPPIKRFCAWVFFCCLSLIGLAACSNSLPATATPTRLSRADPDVESARVYQALIDTLFSNQTQLVIMDHTQTARIGLAPGDVFVKIQENLQHLSAETLADFRVRNDDSYPLRASLLLGVPTLLFSQKDRQELFQVNQSGWDVFYNRYPGAPGIMTFSEVGFNPKMDQALVYLGLESHWLNGSGNFYLLNKVHDTWEIDQQVMTWTS